MFQPDMIPRQVSSAVYRIYDGEAIILDIDSGAYYSLNVTASDIWTRCDGRLTLQTIADDLCREYAVDTEQAWASLERFLSELIAAKLLTVESGGHSLE